MADAVTLTPAQTVQDAATNFNVVLAMLKDNNALQSSLSNTDQTKLENALIAVAADINSLAATVGTPTTSTTTAAPPTVTAGQAAALAIGTLVVGGLVVWGISTMARGKKSEHHEGSGARENPIRRRRSRR